MAINGKENRVFSLDDKEDNFWKRFPIVNEFVYKPELQSSLIQIQIHETSSLPASKGERASGLLDVLIDSQTDNKWTDGRTDVQTNR